MFAEPYHSPSRSMPPTRFRRRQLAFTLLEMMTVILVISILVLLLIPVVGQVKRRLEKTRCIANLRALHVATNSYLQDHHNWPQIPVAYNADQATLATAWIEVLKPYGLTQINWICPTIQQNLAAPDLSDPTNVRVDYTAFPFGSKPQDPFRYATQPWYIENADVHGNGNLLIFPDGHSAELADFLRQMHAH